MMFDLGLTKDELAHVFRRLRSSYTLSTRVQILDLEHAYLTDISRKVLDGQVSVNYEADDTTRGLDLLLYDPDYDLGFDTSTLNDGVWFFDRMIQVVVEFYVPELARIIEVPIFTGPVTGFKRKKQSVTMQAAGKDIFAKRSWPRVTIKAGTTYVDAVQQILRSLGETKFKFEAQHASTLSADRVIDRNSEVSPWGQCRQMLGPLGIRLFYDGEGYAVARKRNDITSVFEFRSGTHGTVLTQPEVDGDYERIANIVRAESTDPALKTAVWEETVDISSPIHPSKLLRGGVPMYLGAVVQQDSIKTAASAKSAAIAELRDRQFAAYRVTFDALPLWMLEEADTITVNVDNVATTTVLTAFTLALKPAVMPIGYNDLVAPTLARIRRTA